MSISIMLMFGAVFLSDCSPSSGELSVSMFLCCILARLIFVEVLVAGEFCGDLLFRLVDLCSLLLIFF